MKLTYDGRTALVTGASQGIGRAAALALASAGVRVIGAARTPGVKALGETALAAIVNRIRFHADFTADNDPYGERDMGSLDHVGERMFRKIDYYDSDLAFGSPDPAGPAVITRILTIMPTAEY